MSSSSRKRRLVSPQQPDEEQAEPRAARRTDRIVVDVGGTRFTTSASTLTSASEYFERLLSPRWCAEPPEELFLDRDPEPFKVLLTYMRTGLLELSKDDPSMARRVMVEAEFLGMQSCIDCVKVEAIKTTAMEVIPTGTPWRVSTGCTALSTRRSATVSCRRISSRRRRRAHRGK